MHHVDNHVETLSLPDAAKHIFEECRMVLPGIQALFGFQMIATFNSGFSEKLRSVEQRIHGVSILSVVIAIAFVMVPAALHRRAEQRSVSDRFIRVSSRFLIAAMMLLAVGLSLDIFVVSRIIWHSDAISVTAAVASWCLFIVLWEIFPTIYRRREDSPRGVA